MNHVDTPACFSLAVRGFGSSNFYLERSIPTEAKLRLCDLETSQGFDRGAQSGKQLPPVALCLDRKQES